MNTSKDVLHAEAIAIRLKSDYEYLSLFLAREWQWDLRAVRSARKADPVRA